MMLFYRVTLTWAVLTLPIFALLAGATGLAMGLWLAGLAVKYHDVSIAVSFGVDIWKYVTPVAYSATLIPLSLQTLYYLNPMAVVVDGFRWALLGATSPPLATSCGVLLLLVTGTFFFRRTERTIVDAL
jgi:lipopolysaccharide transport system permease protein